jgi:hypothetical protein
VAREETDSAKTARPARVFDWLNPKRLAAKAKRAVERRLYGDSFWHLYRNLELFRPYVPGPTRDIVRLAFLSAGQTFPLLQSIIEETGSGRSQVLQAEAFCENVMERSAAEHLKALLDQYGSDKATKHNYHSVYGAILSRIRSVGSLLEIGIGTNNEELVSNMSSMGTPGSSLRAFRDYLPGSKIYGADIDRQVLFQEERIRTFFVDQTDLTSFRGLEALGNFDLIIDDGLHTPNANLAVLLFGIRSLKPPLILRTT